LPGRLNQSRCAHSTIQSYGSRQRSRVNLIEALWPDLRERKRQARRGVELFRSGWNRL